MLSEIQDEGYLFHALPVVRQRPSEEFFHAMCHKIVPPFLEDNMCVKLQALCDQGVTLRFYTDGGCFHPDISEASHAAFALIWDTSHDDAHRQHVARYAVPGQGLPTLSTMLASRIPGVQNIHRAEIMALIFLWEHFTRTEVIVD